MNHYRIHCEITPGDMLNRLRRDRGLEIDCEVNAVLVRGDLSDELLAWMTARRSQLYEELLLENFWYGLMEARKARERLSERLRSAERELNRLRRKLSEKEGELLVENAKRINAELCAQSQSAALEPSMLKTLIQLCHPDKHAGSATATKVTSYLNGLRKRG